MKGFLTRAGGVVLLLTAIVATLLLGPVSMRAADSDLRVYFDDTTLVLKTQTVNRIPYLRLADIVRQFNLPNTSDTRDIFTIRGKSALVVLTRNSAAISVNNQITPLSSPVLHDNGTWLVPSDFLSQGLSRIMETEFRRRSGASRVFAGSAKPSELTMNARYQGTLTRLTLRNSTPVTLELQKDPARHRVVMVFTPRPIDPAKENGDYSDWLVQSIRFNDSDGNPKIVVETSDEVSDVRITSAEENRVHFIDFIRKTDATQSTATTATSASVLALANAGPGAATLQQANAPPKPNAGGIRVIVIDPGHGGTDIGASTMGALEKDLTLVIARKLRSALQSGLGSTVLLTRDSDVPLSSEARASVANNNQADLFVSVHIGYSPNKSDLTSSVYVIQENFAASLSPTEKGARLFLPWYLGYRNNRTASVQVAGILTEELSKAFPGWNFPVRSGPVGVLASTTMPSVLLEIGNINNPVSTQALLDNTFQAKLSAIVTAAIERFAAAKQGTK